MAVDAVLAVVAVAGTVPQLYYHAAHSDRRVRAVQRPARGPAELAPAIRDRQATIAAAAERTRIARAMTLQVPRVVDRFPGIFRDQPPGPGETGDNRTFGAGQDLDTLHADGGRACMLIGLVHPDRRDIGEYIHSVIQQGPRP